MIQCDKIPHLKLYRMKTYLPYIEETPNRNSVLIYNTMNTITIDSVLNHKCLDNTKAKYRRLYIDRKTVQMVNKKKITKNLIGIRKTTYTALKNSNSSVVGVLEGDLKSKINLIYDLSELNKIFFTNSGKVPLRKCAKMYMDYLAHNITFANAYKKKMMVINLDEWLTQGVSLTALLVDKLHMRNPIAYMYLCMRYSPEDFFKLGDLNILMVSSKGQMFRFNPAEMKRTEMTTKKSQSREFRKMLFKLGGVAVNENEINKLEDKALEEETAKEELINTIVRDYAFGANETISQSVVDKIEEVIDKSEVSTVTEFETNEEVVKEINKAVNFSKTGGHHASTKRDEILREAQMNLKVKDKTVQEIIKVKKEDTVIPETVVSKNIFTTNENVRNKKYCNLDKQYNDKIKEADTMNILLDLNNKSIPIFVKSIDVTDSSDPLNYKETYKIVLEDANRIRHTVVVDMPKIIDDKFLYLGGNKKIFNNQELLLPIVKTEPDTVQTVTNYNKIFVRRYGDKLSSNIEKFKKAIISGTVPGCKFKRGDYSKLNAEYLTTLEYDNLSKTFETIQVKEVRLEFDQSKIINEMETKKIKIKDHTIPIGFAGKDPIFVDIDTQHVVGTNYTIIEYVTSKAPKMNDIMSEQSAGKKYMYTRATIMKKQVPLVILLAYFEGMDNLFRRIKLKYYFTDTRPRLGPNDGMVEFANGYLVYENNKLEISLLMNAFTDVPTKSYNYEDFNERDIYSDIFETMFDRRGIASAFDHFYDNFVDPITYSVLEDLNLPTDITGMLIYANNLLVDGQCSHETDQNLYRIRRNEIINAILYKEIATAYEKYYDSSSNKNPTKISLPQNAVIKKILTQQTLEDYSVLNPIVELEKVRAASPKGPSGCNLEEAYKMNKRAFHSSMTGLYTISTSPDGNAGVVRELTLEPNIVSARGYLDIQDMSKADRFNDANLFGAAELLSPLGASRDDSIRLAMATKQSKHIVPVKNASPVLISNGAEQTVQYELSNDFAVIAKEDGVVKEIDEQAGLVIIEYKSGKHEAIDISAKTVKNGAGGFYLTNKLICNLKVGDKVKEKDIIASDKNFFTNSPITGNRFNIGTLLKVAIMSSYSTYEDSTEVTAKMAEEMSSEITMCKEVILGTNANVEYMVKVGDDVEVGDELIRFERSFNEDSYNKLLAGLGDELSQDISMASKDKVKAKYSGKITDIKIYSTVPLEQLSPSLRNIVSSYYNRVGKKKKILNKYDKSDSIVKCGLLLNEPTAPIQTSDGKVKGNQVGEGVLIEIYITYVDELAIGDKIANFTALKGVVGEVIPPGQEAYTLFRPDEEISTCIAPAAIIARMTPSIILTLLGNKVLVELKRKLQDIYEGKQ